MKINIEINGDLLAKAKNLSGIADNGILIERALLLFITIENQRGLKDLWGRVELDEEAFK